MNLIQAVSAVDAPSRSPTAQRRRVNTDPLRRRFRVKPKLSVPRRRHHPEQSLHRPPRLTGPTRHVTTEILRPHEQHRATLTIIAVTRARHAPASTLQLTSRSLTGAMQATNLQSEIRYRRMRLARLRQPRLKETNDADQRATRRLRTRRARRAIGGQSEILPPGPFPRLQDRYRIERAHQVKRLDVHAEAALVTSTITATTRDQVQRRDCLELHNVFQVLAYA